MKVFPSYSTSSYQYVLVIMCMHAFYIYLHIQRVKHKWIIAKLNKPTFCGYCDKLLIPSILGSDRKKYMECSGKNWEIE